MLQRHSGFARAFVGRIISLFSFSLTERFTEKVLIHVYRIRTCYHVTKVMGPAKADNDTSNKVAEIPR